MRFSCVIFIFLDLFICKINVLLFTRLQVYLWVFLVLVLVWFFPFPPFASFACFYKSLRASVYAPFVLPSTPRSSISPVLLCCFVVHFTSTAHLIHSRKAHPCSSEPLSRASLCYQVPPPTLSPINPHHEDALPSPTHYVRCAIMLLVLTYLSCDVCCVCVHVLCVHLLCVLGRFPLIHVLSPTPSHSVHVVVLCLVYFVWCC